MVKKQEIDMRIDFMWIFSADTVPCEDDQKFKDFLKEMYKSATSSFLVVKKDEEKFLKTINEI